MIPFIPRRRLGRPYEVRVKLTDVFPKRFSFFERNMEAVLWRRVGEVVSSMEKFIFLYWTSSGIINDIWMKRGNRCQSETVRRNGVPETQAERETFSQNKALIGCHDSVASQMFPPRRSRTYKSIGRRELTVVGPNERRRASELLVALISNKNATRSSASLFLNGIIYSG